MAGAAVQRFALLLALIGGILHLEGVLQNDLWGAPPGYGMAIIWLAVLVGLAGLAIELRTAITHE